MTPTPTGPRVTGQVIRILRDKGFGFIKADTGGEYFFHRSALTDEAWDTLLELQPVEFTATTGLKGPRAESIALLG